MAGSRWSEPLPATLASAPAAFPNPPPAGADAIRSTALEREIRRRQRHGAREHDREIERAVAVGVAFDVSVAGLVNVAQLAGHAGEGPGADPREGLVAAERG